MSIWTRIAAVISALASGESLADALARLRTPPERTVAFTIAVIALGAKMAKADGKVTIDEVRAFREVFHIEPADEAHAAHVFNLARQDVAGFEIYAARIARMFDNDPEPLNDLLEGLFHIAVADGVFDASEEAFLLAVADEFQTDARTFASFKTRYVPGAPPDPYIVLGVSPDDPLDLIRDRWRALVREAHPDRMVARGLPEEALAMASRRLAAINAAWEEIQAAA